MLAPSLVKALLVGASSLTVSIVDSHPIGSEGSRIAFIVINSRYIGPLHFRSESDISFIV